MMVSGDSRARSISIENVSHGFSSAKSGSVMTLDDVSLEIYECELLSLLGPSGCGKSTLLNIIGGLLRPTSGVVRIGTTEVKGPSPRKLSFVFQDNTLFPWNTISENILVALEFIGVPQAERQARAESALAAVGLQDFAGHYPRQLSGGMKQRASLARSLSLETDIILMDEPFAALDEQTRTFLGEELSVLLSKTKKTIVMVTHSLSEAVFLSDRIAVMTSRPAHIKSIVNIDQPHPRGAEFMSCREFADLRNELYSLLRVEIKRTVGSLSGAAAE